MCVPIMSQLLQKQYTCITIYTFSFYLFTHNFSTLQISRLSNKRDLWPVSLYAKLLILITSHTRFHQIDITRALLVKQISIQLLIKHTWADDFYIKSATSFLNGKLEGAYLYFFCGESENSWSISLHVLCFIKKKDILLIFWARKVKSHKCGHHKRNYLCLDNNLKKHTARS